MKQILLILTGLITLFFLSGCAYTMKYQETMVKKKMEQIASEHPLKKPISMALLYDDSLLTSSCEGARCDLIPLEFETGKSVKNIGKLFFEQYYFDVTLVNVKEFDQIPKGKFDVIVKPVVEKIHRSFEKDGIWAYILLEFTLNVALYDTDKNLLQTKVYDSGIVKSDGHVNKFNKMIETRYMYHNALLSLFEKVQTDLSKLTIEKPDLKSP